MSENTSGLDPDGWPAILIKKLLYLDPTKPPFVWSSAESSEPSDDAAAAAATSPPLASNHSDEAAARSAQRNMKKLFTVKLVVGTLSDQFKIRCITKGADSAGIALCSFTGQLLEIIKASSISEARYQGDRLDLTISKKNELLNSAAAAQQLISIYFINSSEGSIFIHCMERGLKIKVQIERANKSNAAKLSAEPTTTATALSNLDIKDKLIIDGSGYTESGLTVIFKESAVNLNPSRGKPLYPFLQVVWSISLQPGSSPSYNRDCTLDNTLQMEIISAMAGRWIFVECVLINERKKVSAIKGPILPAVTLSKRLLRTFVAGEGTFPVSIRADDLQYIISNLPDRYSLNFPQPDPTANSASMIICRFIITPKGLSIALPNDVLRGKREAAAAAGDDLRLYFDWRECYLTLPDVYELEEKTILQSEFSTGYRANLEFYGSDQESWISTQLDFAKSEHRNIVWHYSIFMTVAQLASEGGGTGKGDSHPSLPELETFLPQFERDLRIGNVQNVQKSFRLIWKALDYTQFKDSVQTPDMFITTLEQRKQRQDKIFKASETNRAANRASKHKKGDDTSDKRGGGKRGGAAHYMDALDDPNNALVEYEVTETPDKGLDVADWHSSSSSSGDEVESQDS